MTGASKLINCMPAALFSLLFLTILNFQAMAQVYDDFSDGNFTANPEWTGDTADFKISNSSAIPAEMKPGLQLDAEESGISSLVVENSMINNTEWRFWVKLSFNTSANNFARIYLTSDQEDLSGTLSGYYVQIGGSNDSIGLYRQEGDTGFLVCQGENIFTGNTTNAIRLKITRDESGNWQMFADPDGGFNFQPEGSGMDGTITSTGYFGLYCRYTSSNATKFYFDDFYVSELNADTIPPEVVSVSVESANTLSVHFSEPVEQIGAENPGNYVVQPGSVTPSSAMRDGTALSKVHLEFEDDFTPGVNYSVLISDIGDLSGNFLEQDSATFYISELTGVDPFSIVINEIMADVDPEPIGLPFADYLELYNSNPYPVNLEGFTLKPRESADPIAFPSAVILPDSFLIVTLPADTQFFTSFGPVVGLPGFSLNNEGVSALRNPDGSLVHAIGYQKSWYKDDEKEDGGWALEQIDPLNPCTGGDNWRASNHESGGTPGERNSVDAQNIFAPTIESVVAISQNMTEISFSQIMDSVPMMMPGIFEVDGGIGFPASVNLESPFFTKAYLSFDQPFVENQVYTMTLADTVYGCSGSFIAPGKQFEFVLPVEAEPFEIVFNEVMPDPDPPVELPQYEYIEVFNTTVDYKGIRGWMLQVGETVKPIPDAVIDPHGYLIFTDSEVEQLFGLFGPAVGFSSLGLSNSGTTLKLLNSEGLLMSVLAYEPSWYMDGEKAEGGYSLEQIDPFNPCAGEENWSETLSEKGGTPGTLNSVDAENEVLPSIDHIIALDPQTFEVYFSQVMNRSTLTNPASYTVDHTVGNPVSVTITDSTYRKVRLMFGVQLLKGEVYLMTFPNTILNCNGNPVSQNLTVPFGIHENPKRADVVINEVLFNPAGEGVDFVEIYNRSEKILSLAELKLGDLDVDEFGNSDTAYKSVSEVDQLLFPGDYRVLTTSPQKVKDQYFTENPEAFTQMVSFPGYSNSSGSVILGDIQKNWLDAFNYNEEMHHPLLNTVEGVSLERIHYDRPASDVTNWHSASADAGYATPGYKNSQFSESSSGGGEVWLDPEVFSPDNDGYHDVLNINYTFEKGGNTAGITIYDANGRLVRQLLNNEILGTEGTFSWDGRTDDNQKAAIGIYIIFFETFDLQGNLKKFKKTAVLAK